MYSEDLDIKIAGDKPSKDIKLNRRQAEEFSISKSDLEKAKLLGKKVANSFINDANHFSVGEEVDDYSMIIQRRLLLSFTTTVGFEQYCPSDTICGIAQKSFLDTLKKNDSELYNTSSDTGAFSFYYLAFRRGSEIDRRIGQTFAMLCAHDGDPVYQELGEALYCWFLSVVRKAVKELEFGN